MAVKYLKQPALSLSMAPLVALTNNILFGIIIDKMSQ